MQARVLKGFLAILLITACSKAFAGYRTMLDPRSMAMGGTGVAASTKFNASYHNPALIAFNRGDKPDKIYISSAVGAREIYDTDFENNLQRFVDSDLIEDFENALGGTIDEALTVGRQFQDGLRDLNMQGYRKDEMSVFSLLVDAEPVTINFYIKRDIREMTVIRNLDEKLINDRLFEKVESGSTSNDVQGFSRSTVDDTYYELSEFGVSVATTDVISYNMPISWGFTPKLFSVKGSHRATDLYTYDPKNPPDRRVSSDFLEWNLDVGFSMLLTDAFLREELGASGDLLSGEWIFSLVGMNLFPSDFTPFAPVRADRTYPGNKRAIQALYQMGIAHYQRDYMLTMDIDLTENEVYDFEGVTRFLSIGGEYFWRDNFHLRAGMRFNLAQTSEGSQEKATLTGGFMYQPHGFSIELAGMVNEVEAGGTVGFGLAF